MRGIGVLGGTFDPVHFGHLRIALEIFQELDLAEVRFLPCHLPPHRAEPLAASQDRLAMLQLAVQGQGGFCVDERELQRPGFSYMVDTLESLRTEFPARSLCLIMGMDAFAGLDRWYRWEQLLTLAHLVIVCRPGSHAALPPAVAALVAERRAADTAALWQHNAGRIWFQAVSQLDISASRIRALVREDKSARYLLPDAVWRYLCENKLYR